MRQQANMHSIHRHWWWSKWNILAALPLHGIILIEMRKSIPVVEFTIKWQLPWNTSRLTIEIPRAVHCNSQLIVVLFPSNALFGQGFFCWQTPLLVSKCANCHKSTNFNHVHLTIDCVLFGLRAMRLSLLQWFASIQRRVNIIDDCPTHIPGIVILNLKMLTT